MNVIQAAPNGIVNEKTIFRFKQRNNIVNAEYSGGKIKKGYLIGFLQKKVLTFTYCQFRLSGELDHGKSKCVLSVDPNNGKLKLTEKFDMKTESSTEIGINVFMEI
ncbi:hypothetical protein [Hanstruepera marina]|uniref:hypothetical protein n=1 Tax=Hanstruepera marina TaxID=2873265 RepID=UPI001CA607D5|nr:hypothetical protein [Hanstruepera marina]